MNFLRRVIVFTIKDDAVVYIEQVHMNKFEYPLGYDKNEIGRDIDVGALRSISIETAL